MKAWYGRIKRRRGSKIARVAVMRRLATIIWHMVKHNEPYVVGGPPRRKLPAQGGVSLTTRMTKVRCGSRIFGGMVGQMNEAGRQNGPGGDRPPGPYGSFTRPSPAIPCRVASPQSPTPLHRTKPV